MAISMLKIRRPLGRLIFNMGIAIPGKTVFLIETAPSIIMVERDYINLPPPLSSERNIAENWREWRQLFELYLVATESEEKPDKMNIAK